ncbi:MAG TPA: PAS domain-containing sensor histidine kinase [Polyangia bacterium]|nr:PAS domain-containing sensor histidine kinase [Polyangia bacterium]
MNPETMQDGLSRQSTARKSRERDRRLLDSMPQCIWAADAEGRVNYWNPAGLEYCGLDAAALTDGSFWEVLHADDRDEARVHWERGLRGEPTFERQLRLRRASDGKFRWHLVRAVAERDDDGAVIGWIATATDIDDQKRAEDQLREAVALRDDFLSVASHELRTPLTALKLEVSNLLRLARHDAGSDRARLIAKAERIDAQAARLRGLIDDLLDVSRLASGQLALRLEPLDRGAGAAEVGARFIDEAARLGSTLTVDVEPGAVGRWDRERLEQVVSNLISNAVKYGGGQPIEVAVRAAAGGGRLTVRDRGLGIAPEDQGRIFGRFERAVPSGNYGGIGLGLWIVKQLVGVFGGAVGVESEPGAGSVFTVELPYEAPAQRAARASAHEAATTARAAAPSSTCTAVRGARALANAAPAPITAPNASPKRWA